MIVNPFSQLASLLTLYTIKLISFWFHYAKTCIPDITKQEKRSRSRGYRSVNGRSPKLLHIPAEVYFTANFINDAFHISRAIPPPSSPRNQVGGKFVQICRKNEARNESETRAR